MKDFRNIALFVLLVGAVPLFTDSGVMLNFVMTSLYACLLSQAWNVLGGFGGQFSFLARVLMCRPSHKCSGA